MPLFGWKERTFSSSMPSISPATALIEVSVALISLAPASNSFRTPSVNDFYASSSSSHTRCASNRLFAGVTVAQSWPSVLRSSWNR